MNSTPNDWLEVSRLIVESDVARMRAEGKSQIIFEDAKRVANEARLKELRDIIAAQDKLIKEYQHLIELLRKAS